MKKQISIWMLYAGSTVKKLLALLVLMAAAEAVLFRRAANSLEQTGELWARGLDRVFAQSWIPLVFFVIFLLWTAVLLVKSHADAACTLERLQLPGKNILAIHTCYNILSYLVLLAVQVLVLVGLFRWYGSTVPESIYGPQSIMLAFYRSEFLHSLLPLADWTRYLRTLGVTVGMGLAVAGASRGMRESQAWVVPVLILAAILFFFYPGGMGLRGGDFALGVMFPFVGGVMAWQALADDREEA